MRVAFVTHQYFPRFYSGVERDTLNVTKQLRRLGHDSIVITPALGDFDGGGRYVHEGTHVHAVAEGVFDRYRPWASSPEVVPAIAGILEAEQVELVHVAHAMRLPQAHEAAAQRGLPRVVHLHDYDYLCFQILMVRADGSICTGAADGRACIEVCNVPTARERIEWGRRVLASAAAVVSPSRFLIDVFAAEGFDTVGWHHVPCGVDYSLFPERLPAPESDGLQLGFIGTLLPHKGPRVLVEALRLLPDRPIRVTIHGESFGQTSFDAQLLRLAEDDPRIGFAGSYEYGGFADVLAPLDAVVLPSLWYENYPISAASAVAAGVPVIASDIGGLREVIDAYGCGFTFRLGDPESLAALLDRLVEDPEMLARKRREMLYPPSVEEEAWAMARIYEDVLARGLVPT